MKFIKENLLDLILLIGITNISIGFFIYSIFAGFIATGTMLIVLALYAVRGGD